MTSAFEPEHDVSPSPVFHPVVGDNVNFFGLVLDPDIGLGPYAAIVTRLYGESGVVDLTVFPPGQPPSYMDLVPSMEGRGVNGRYWAELPF
jgi:hypothetical protein